MKNRQAKVMTNINSTRKRRIVDLAIELHHCDGQCEIDRMSEISEGEQNGAYVQAWVWVDFAGTDIDKNRKDRIQA